MYMYMYVEGLIDAIDAKSFDLKLEVWHTRWESLVPGTEWEFCSWLIEYKCLVIKSTVLRPFAKQQRLVVHMNNSLRMLASQQ